MKRTLTLISVTLAFLGGLLSCSTYLNTQLDDFGSADLLGMVYDNHSQPCPGARVSIDGKAGPVSDVNGRFTLINVSRGRHTLTVKKDDFEEAAFAIEYLNRSQIVYCRIFSFNQILELAESALAEGKLQEAAGHLARTEKIKADDPLLLYLKAVLELKSGRPNEALALFLALAAKPPVEPHVHLAIADIYEHELKDLPQAVEYLRKFLSGRESEEVRARIRKLEGMN